MLSILSLMHAAEAPWRRLSSRLSRESSRLFSYELSPSSAAARASLLSSVQNPQSESSAEASRCTSTQPNPRPQSRRSSTS